MSPDQADISSPEGLVNALFNHGLAPALAHGITEDELEAVYAQGCQDLEQGLLDEALGHLTFLVSQAPWDRRFQYSLGLCQQHRGEYASAGSFFANALMLDATDALSAFRMGECLAAQDDFQAARGPNDSPRPGQSYADHVSEFNPGRLDIDTDADNARDFARFAQGSTEDIGNAYVSAGLSALAIGGLVAGELGWTNIVVEAVKGVL